MNTTTGAPTWDEVLDDYDRALTRQEHAVADGTDGLDALALEVFVPPRGLGPLPQRLRARAEQLQHRTTTLTEHVGRLVTDATPEPPTVRHRTLRAATSTLDLRV